MAEFLNNLSATKIGKRTWQLNQPLLYRCDKLDRVIAVPAGFVCDFESIDRWLLLGYILLAHTADRAGVVHDYLYRYDSDPTVKQNTADAVYREASESVGNRKWQSYAKWLGVRLGGRWSYHKKSITWKPKEAKIS